MLALLAAVRGKLLLLLIWTLAGAAAAGGINLLLPVVYEATAKVVVATPYWNDSTALDDPNFGGATNLAFGDEFTQQRMTSYSRLVTTPMVTGRVADRLRLSESADELAKKLTGHVVPESVILDVKAEDASPARAAMIADAAAQQTIYIIKDVERPPYTLVSPVQPLLFQPAPVPSHPISPRTLLNVFSGAILGLLLGLTYIAAYAAAKERRRLARIRGGDGTLADELTGALGVVTADEQPPAGGSNTDMKLLRIEVAHLLNQAGAQSVLTTAPRATAATGRIATLLATALIEAGSPTIVVSADFTAEHDDPRVGLGDLLRTASTLDSAIETDDRTGLSWIPAGTPPEDPTRELTGTKMRDLLGDLAARYRYVIVVGPATLELADAVDMASVTGASILVDPVSQTTAGEVRESERLLRLARGTYLGRVAVIDQSFSEELETPRSDPRRPATSGQQAP